jgi:hypothetical protein
MEDRRKVMSEKGKNRDRAQRRADALRENLRRRKLQARSRTASAKGAVKPAPGEAGEQSGPDIGKR